MEEIEASEIIILKCNICWNQKKCAMTNPRVGQAGPGPPNHNYTMCYDNYNHMIKAADVKYLTVITEANN